MIPVTPDTTDPSARFEPADPGARATHRAAQPRRMLRMSMASYALDTVLLLLLWAVGVDAGGAAVALALGAATIHAVFDRLFASGWSERRTDRFLTVPQLVASSTLLLGVAASVPVVALPLTSLLFIVFAFAALRMQPRQAAGTWAGISLLMLVVFASAPEARTLPGATPAQAALSALWMCLVLGRCALVGLYGSTLRQKLVRRGRDLAQASGELRTLAMRDGLTGALNRRAIMQTLDDALLADVGSGLSVAVILVDLDHFKSINDRFGHPAGDEVLRRFVILAARVLRGVDRLGRYGGEEFLLVPPGVAGTDAAVAIAERLRASVAEHPWHEVAAGLAVTVSTGVACARPGESARAVLERVDRALYRAKHDGRDCVRTDPAAPTRA
jgi:diguanylate cyclase (GGDEF)-like protein